MPYHIVLLGVAGSLMVGAVLAVLVMRTRYAKLEKRVRRSITAHREARRRLSENEKLLQRAEAVSRVGGFMIDLATGVQQWTPQSYRIHDLDPECTPTTELVDSFLSPAVRERLHEATRKARETGEGYDLEFPIITARQRSIWVRVSAEVERDQGVPIRIVGAMQDVTDRCKLEQRLRDAIAVADRASRSKSEFLANMSHEIRTPLNAVIGLGYLLEHTPLNEEQRQFLTKIQFAGRALLGVINNVLDLSKIEADEMSLEDEPLDLPELVREVSQMLLPQAVDKGIALIVEPDTGLPHRVMGDALRIKQILTNLVNNAIKFTEQGHVRVVVFCAEKGSGRVRLRCEIKDTGIGIEPAACERLFTPFTQADASTTRRFGGTGLGLSIARRFVELMGGEIGVVSTVGEGSTFWIELPLRVAPEADGTLDPNALRIVILDPTGDTPGGLAAMVRALGWNPQVVDSGDQMMAVFNDAAVAMRPDALILDLHEHDLEAHAVINRLAGTWRDGDLPSVIVVAESPQSYLEHKGSMRAHDVLLVRPVTSSALFNAINLAVSRRPDSCEKVFESTNFDELHAQWLSGVRVLVVDDSDINLEVAQRILENQGATVTTSSDGSAALDLLHRASQDVDLILMDVQMPILDGNEAARRIRTELRLNIPIVALTAGALVGERQRSLDAGMNDFVSKPFDPQVLIKKVRRLVEKSRGEPIPMVFDDRRHDKSSTIRPFMKSINAAVVQQLFGDDVSLFKTLLARMLREYADLALPAAPDAGDALERSTLKARVHKLKGSAGMVGAGAVMRLAGAAERALHEERSGDVVQRILAKLAASLVALNDEAQSLLVLPTSASATPSPDSAAELAPSDLDPADLKSLCELLESQNLAAVDKFEALAPVLRTVLDADCFQGLTRAVEDLDFQRGADFLRDMPMAQAQSAA